MMAGCTASHKNKIRYGDGIQFFFVSDDFITSEIAAFLRRRIAFQNTICTDASLFGAFSCIHRIRRIFLYSSPSLSYSSRKTQPLAMSSLFSIPIYIHSMIHILSIVHLSISPFIMAIHIFSICCNHRKCFPLV